MADNTNVLQNDLLLYNKNKLPATLALLGLIFNVLFFCIAYSITTPALNDGSVPWFRQIIVGGSVLLTLVTLLVTFLASEGIKAYNKKYVIVLLVLAVIQFARIFVFPLYTLQHTELYRAYFWIRTGTSTLMGIMMIVWLCLSVACLVASAIIGYINCVKREKHLALVESGSINISAIIKQEDEQTAGNVAAAKKEVK